MSSPPEPAPVSPFRLVGTLSGAGMFAGLALVFVYQATLPRIERNKAEALKKAIHEVLHDPARYDTLYLHQGKLTPKPPGKTKQLERVYLGYDQDNKRIGYAVVHDMPGFQDKVKVIFGYNAQKQILLGMRVLESKETPGLGDKIEKDQVFVKQFEGPATPLKGVKSGAKSKPNEIDMITGATISSKVVIKIINTAIKKWKPLLDAYKGAEQ